MSSQVAVHAIWVLFLLHLLTGLLISGLPATTRRHSEIPSLYVTVHNTRRHPTGFHFRTVSWDHGTALSCTLCSVRFHGSCLSSSHINYLIPGTGNPLHVAWAT
jgi:hypothetical protein